MTRPELFIGLDVGTTGSKAAVYDHDGKLISLGRAQTPWQTVKIPTPSGAQIVGTELDAYDLLNAAQTAISRALEEVPDGHVLAVGVTSMAESGVLLDSHGTPLAPVIAWHDLRDSDQTVRLDAEIGANVFSERTGLPYRSQWSLTKHLWQVENEPTAKCALRRLNIAEWIVRGLGGEEASDVSLASRTGWLDLASRAWWPEALEWSGASASLLPPLVNSGSALGRVSSSVGMDRLTNAVLTTAGHDHQAAAFGADAAGAGEQFDSCGTAEALVRTVPVGLSPESIAQLTRVGVTVGWHVLDDRWALLGATQGGLALERLAGLFHNGDERETVARLETAASSSVSGRVQVKVDEGGCLTIDGIRDGVGSGEVWLAALQAITDQIQAVNVQMTKVVGPHRRTVVAGGWANSVNLMHFKQAAFGDVVRSKVDETGTRGAAILARGAAADN